MARSVVGEVESLVSRAESLWGELVQKLDHLDGDVLVVRHEEVHGVLPYLHSCGSCGGVSDSFVVGT